MSRVLLPAEMGPRINQSSAPDSAPMSWSVLPSRSPLKYLASSRANSESGGVTLANRVAQIECRVHDALTRTSAPAGLFFNAAGKAGCPQMVAPGSVPKLIVGQRKHDSRCHMPALPGFAFGSQQSTVLTHK